MTVVGVIGPTGTVGFMRRTDASTRAAEKALEARSNFPSSTAAVWGKGECSGLVTVCLTRKFLADCAGNVPDGSVEGSELPAAGVPLTSHMAFRLCLDGKTRLPHKTMASDFT
jgi:hypothetical protein